MGLDITAYSGLRLAPDAAVESDGSPVDYRNFCHISQETIDGTEKHWPGRTAGLPAPGVYSFAGVLRFRAGSYIGFNEWRDTFARQSGYDSARTVWESPDRFKGMPFVELINFSDCEGYIGPVVATKITNDFCAALKITGPDWFMRLYHLWHKAFVLASHDGALEFH